MKMDLVTTQLPPNIKGKECDDDADISDVR